MKKNAIVKPSTFKIALSVIAFGMTISLVMAVFLFLLWAAVSFLKMFF